MRCLRLYRLALVYLFSFDTVNTAQYMLHFSQLYGKHISSYISLYSHTRDYIKESVETQEVRQCADGIETHPVVILQDYNITEGLKFQVCKTFF